LREDEQQLPDKEARVHPLLSPGNRFPEFSLPDHTGRLFAPADLAEERPLVLAFVRGWWCPKEQVRLRMLVAMQDEVQREYGRIAVITTDSPYVNGAFRAGLGADFPFLSDETRALAGALDLVECTDERHRPYVPMTFLLDSALRIQRSWCGFWFRGNPTPEELRIGLREITMREQPTFDPFAVWAGRGSAPPADGLEADAIWIREDGGGHEIQRGRWTDELPATGTPLHRSEVDGRRWRVVAVETDDGRPAVHLRKDGPPGTNPLPMHGISAPPSVKAF
jgi:peroxiredoxin